MLCSSEAVGSFIDGGLCIPAVVANFYQTFCILSGSFHSQLYGAAASVREFEPTK